MAPLRGRKTDVSVGDDEITTALGLNSDLSVSIDQWADEFIATDTEAADNNENNEPSLRADISPAESKFAAKLMEEISKGAKDSQSAPAQKMCRAMDEAENTHTLQEPQHSGPASVPQNVDGRKTDCVRRVSRRKTRVVES